MAEARSKDEWSRMSALLALLANCHRDPKKTRAFKPVDFDPFARRAAPVEVGMEAVREFFTTGRLPGTDARVQ